MNLIINLLQEIREYIIEYAEEIKKEDLLNMLIIYRTINEISFHTEKAIKTLKFLYAEEIKESNRINSCRL